jgi:hypothetical protein
MRAEFARIARMVCGESAETLRTASTLLYHERRSDDAMSAISERISTCHHPIGLER